MRDSNLFESCKLGLRRNINLYGDLKHVRLTKGEGTEFDCIALLKASITSTSEILGIGEVTKV